MTHQPRSTVLPLTSVPVTGFKSFLNAPVQTDLASLQADVAILGIPYAIPYEMGQSRSASAPAYIREKSSRLARATIPNVGFDRAKTPGDLSQIRIVDCGDVPFDPLDIRGGVNRATEAVKAILNRGAVPVVFGGDDAVPIPVVRAYENHGPLVVIQIDEHMDWMTDRNGVTEGYSSPMRRIAEMPWVKQTIQIGLHSFGAADQFKDALTAGSILITEQEVHLKGVPAILDMIPADENYFITVDMDGFETTFMPAVSHPEPGGLTFRESVDLLCGLAARGRIVGMDWVEFVPDHDLNGLGGHSVGRLIANLLQSMVDAGRFRKR